MKIMSFVAGVATGVLLNQYMTRSSGPARGPAMRPAAQGDNLRRAAAGSARGLSGPERDYPTHAPPQNDEQLRDRIRAQVARTIANPQAIEVEVSGGCVTLRGQVQARDSLLLMAEVENTAGVTSVQNQLDIQGSLDEIAPPMTRDKPAVREGERATSRMS